jgi:hypothetical protein
MALGVVEVAGRWKGDIDVVQSGSGPTYTNQRAML